MIKITFLISLFFFSTSIFASGLEGIISDEAGQPLTGATIFVESAGQGAVTNGDGYYHISLPTGKQKVVFQFLGYESQSKVVTIPDNGLLTLNVTMKEQTFQLPELEVSGSDKELANAIMRKAIAKADYHRLQLDKYTATVYIKGSGRLKKTPRLLRKQIEKEGIDSTMSFTSESVSEITYERPNKYSHKVISIFEQGESNNTSPMQIVKGSFYEDNIADKQVSPLSKRAFAYYKFNLEGYFLDRGYGVNKIKVTPRSRGENVFEGYLYILEDYWSIHSLDLTYHTFGVKVDIHQIYAPVQEEVWMPITQKIIFNGKFFGFALEYIYNAISSDYKVQINPDLDASFAIVDNKNKITTAVPAPEVSKDAPALERLNADKELTRKELRKIIRDYEKKEEKNKVEKEVLYEESFAIDSMARKKDSTYWATIRPIPLTKYEIKGYSTTDSLNQVQKTKDEKEELTGKNTKSQKSLGLFNLFTGIYKKTGDHSAFFTDGLAVGATFNPAEGYSLRETLNFSHSENGNKQQVYLTPRYAFARDEFYLKGGLKYDISSANKVKTNIHLEGGNYLYQYNESGAIIELLNAFENLISERNYIHLFQKKYAKATYQRKSNKWDFSSSLEWANRYTVNNATTQTYWNRENRDYAANIPVNNEATLPLANPQKATVFSVSIEGKPWLKYHIKNDNKQVIPGSSPIVGLRYKKGINGLLDSEVDYDLIEAWVKKKFKVRAGTNLQVNVNAGWFINNKALGFSDFKHFKGNRLAITDIDPTNSFRLMDYYRYSTRDKFLAVNAHYQFRKFLLSQIPEVWMLGIKENIFVNALSTPYSDNYWEAGYALENIFRIFRIEVAASFNGNQYRDWGILIGVSSVFTSDGSGINISF